MDGKVIFNAGSYGLFFAFAIAIVLIGLYLLLSGAISAFRARNNAERVPTAVYIGSVLGLILVLIPIYPLELLRSTNELLASSEDEMYEFVGNMVRITSKGFTMYKDTLPAPTPDPLATPTPLYTQDGTPVYATETSDAPPTATAETAVQPTVTGVWPTLPPALTADPQMTPVNSEMVPTPTIDIVSLATRNADSVVAAPTMDMNTWNILTPPPTPAR